MKSKYSRELKIGLTVLVMLLVLFFGINYLKGINLFHASNFYYVSYTDVAGLAQSAPVTVNGYKVGLVREIEYEYNNPGHVLVEISLDKKLRVPHGTKAVLTTDMLGTSSIVLEMGTSPEYYAVGERLEGTNSAGLVESLSSGLMPSINAMVPKIDSLLTSLNILVSDPALRVAIGRLDAITANLEGTTRMLHTTSSSLPRIAAGADSTLTNLRTVSGNLAQLSEQMRDLPVDSTFRNLEALSVELKAMAAALNSSESSLGLLMHDPELYNNLNRAVSNLDTLFVDIKKNPKRYISIKLL